ncbi:MAG: hypothetical protein H7Y86_10250 [Rhizobacter sp.]|nr:hypothetical protein [Ferruginibacter sp.]
MKVVLVLWASFFLFSCNNPDNTIAAENREQGVENDSLKESTPVIISDTITAVPEIEKVRSENLTRAGVHPISLQWISWDKKGEVSVKPSTEEWYNINGSQTNTEKDFLKIDGRIKRVSEKELEFEGTIEIKVSHNYGGGPCIKTGKQSFVAKGNRKYFRLQNMENCQGGNLVDYVDIYPGTSSL